MMVMSLPGTLVVLFTSMITGQCFLFISEGSVDGNDTFVLGSNATLLCVSKRTEINIRLAINNTSVVDCSNGRCEANMTAAGGYRVSHNYDEGRTKLYIDSVSVKDTYNNFSCDSHPNVSFIQLKISRSSTSSSTATTPAGQTTSNLFILVLLVVMSFCL